MARIIDIEGIGKTYAAKLVDHGISTTEKLLEEAASASGRKKLAEAIGVSEKVVLEWVNRADLMRIKGVGEEFSDLLEQAGVDSPSELARRNAENLHAAIVEINDKKNLVNRVPSVEQIQGFIDDAKTLEKIVTH